MRKSPLFVVVVLALSGCVVIPKPYIKVTAPEIRGRVIDPVTQQPVPEVTIGFEGQDAVRVVSRPDGTFRLPRQRDLILTRVFTPCPVYEYPEPRRLPGAIVLEKPGWERRTLVLRPFFAQLHHAKRAGTIWHPNTWEDPVVEVGDVMLSHGRAELPASRTPIEPGNQTPSGS